MSMKVFSCYSSGEGFYHILNNKDFFVFFNVVFPCSIKDLYKAFALKKDYKLKVLSVKSFIKLAALRDNYFFLSLLYPRGFVCSIGIDQLIGKSNFLKFENALKDVGEIVAMKISPNVIVTITFWKEFLNYGLFLNHSILVFLILRILKILFCFNYNVFSLLNLLLLSSYDNRESVNL